MGIRTLFLILAIIGVVWLIRRSWRQLASSKTPRPAQVGQMVKCSHCGLHIPRDEAIYDANDLSYCSQNHRELGPGKDAE